MKKVPQLTNPLDQINTNALFAKVVGHSGQVRKNREQAAVEMVTDLMHGLHRAFDPNTIEEIAEDEVAVVLHSNQGPEAYDHRRQAALLLSAFTLNPQNQTYRQLIESPQSFQEVIAKLLGIQNSQPVVKPSETVIKIRKLAAKVKRRNFTDAQINLVWQQRDNFNMQSYNLLIQPSCEIFNLERVAKPSNSNPTTPDLVTLLRNLAQGEDQKDIIEKFTKREWLVAIFAFAKSQDPQKPALGDLLREPEVFDWLYSFIDKHSKIEEAETDKAIEPESLSTRIRELAKEAKAFFDADWLQALWRAKLRSKKSSIDFLNQSHICSAFTLKPKKAETNKCTATNVIILLENLAKRIDQEKVINRFTKREWLAAIININEVTNNEEIAALIREANVFNWLYELIHNHAAEEQEIKKERKPQQKEPAAPEPTSPRPAATKPIKISPIEVSLGKFDLREIELAELLQEACEHIGIDSSTAPSGNKRVTLSAFWDFIDGKYPSSNTRELKTNGDKVQLLKLAFEAGPITQRTGVPGRLRQVGNLTKLLNGLKAI